MLRSSSLTPLRSKLGDLADFLQRKLLNGDLLRLRSLRLKVPDSEPLPPFGAFNTTHVTHATLLTTYIESHRQPSFILELWSKESKGRECLLNSHRFSCTCNACSCEIHFIRQDINSGKDMIRFWNLDPSNLLLNMIFFYYYNN